MIVGLTGRNASGKGETSEFLKAKGFTYHSLSDVLREELRRRNQDITRESLIALGRELRAAEGGGVLASRILKRIEHDRNYVIDSFRHPGEVEVFRSAPEFTLISIEAAPELRFERIRARDREGDPVSLEDFVALEEEEASNPRSEGQQLLACRELADHRLVNNGSRQELQETMAQLLKENMGNMARPGWDDYFMKMAQVASLRSNCVKRKVAAIIVRDKRVISTGYNGTPRGTKNCYEGGCPRCNDLAESGTRLDECLCSHGEENAITQAAYHGVSLRDAILYTTFAPCLMCTKMIINAGIREVIYNRDYPLNDTSFKLLEEAGVACRQHQVD